MESLSKADKIDFKKARTFKGRRVLDELKPKEIEGVKKTLFLKGNKTSNFVTKALQSLVIHTIHFLSNITNSIS